MKARLIVFAVLIFVTLIIFLFCDKIPNDNASIALVTTVTTLFIAIILMERFFTTPTDAFVNSFAAIILIATSGDVFTSIGHWYLLLASYVAIIFILSSAAIILFEIKDSHSAHFWSQKISKLTTSLGSGRAIWFLIFLCVVIANYRLTDRFSTSLLLFVGFVVAFDRPLVSFITGILSHKAKILDELGVIIGVQSQNVFLARLNKYRAGVSLFDAVAFRYAIGSYNEIATGVIIDRFLLDEQRWVRILRYPMRFDPSLRDMSENTVVSLADPANEFSLSFVGLVDKDSTINVLKFRYLTQRPVYEGQILSANIDGKELLYQIAEARTNVERLEDKNDTGFIIGEAVQLGCWNSEKRCFERYGWLPNVMTPVFRADALPAGEVDQNKIVAGIRDIKIPVSFDFDEGIKHHVAILGVTGSGKSVFARHLIRTSAINGVKIICVDLTGEYKDKFTDLRITKFSELINFDLIAEKTRSISAELSKFPNQQNATFIATLSKEVSDNMTAGLNTFMASEDQILIVDLPDLENSAEMLDFLRHLFICVFRNARLGLFADKKIAIALEEAHTIVPEHNFMSTNDRRMNAVVNAIGQIALQGRKYNIGLVVIAQRTATVSKTILTQCNTIFAFQQFDKTSIEFLSSYFGDFARALPLLNPRDMVVVGKGVGSSVPFIATVADLPDI